MVEFYWDKLSTYKEECKRILKTVYSFLKSDTSNSLCAAIDAATTKEELSRIMTNMRLKYL